MTSEELLQSEIETTYAATLKLMDRLAPDALDPAALAWKPPSGTNWMTTGQLLYHLTGACGMGFRGFITGDWGLPDGRKMDELSPEEMTPPAEALPAISSVNEAKKLIAQDKQLALEMLDKATDSDLANKLVPTPWDPSTSQPLVKHLFLMLHHLQTHKAQLFYYLKLQGQQVNTADLWG